MITRISITAGSVWEFLDKNEEVDLSGLFSGIDYSSDLILMSLGWLVRKGYVIMERDEENYKIHLRKDIEQGLGKIKCPDFQEGKQGFCLASKNGLMSPSVYELENFCLSGRYENCPLRQKLEP